MFKPAGIPLSQIEIVEVGLDELEALRLCDFEGLHQEEAAEAMEVSRGTVQRLLQSGRKKLLDVVVHGKALAIHESEHVFIRPIPRGHGRRGGRRHGQEHRAATQTEASHETSPASGTE